MGQKLEISLKSVIEEGVFAWLFLLLNAPLASSSQQIDGRTAKGITVLLSVDLECLHFGST